MKKMYNGTTIEGLVYQHDLELKVSGPNSANPGTEFISGNIEIATDNAMVNIVPVHYTYVTATNKNGKSNNTFIVLKNFIDKVYKTVMADGAENASMVKIDSAIVKNGTFEFKGQADSIVKSSYVTYMKNDKRMLTLLFVENGNIKVALNEKDSQVSGTPCNDTYQNFMTSYKAIGEELKAIYTKAQQDSTLTAEQRDSLMTLLDEKQEQGMDKVYQTISDCIETPVGVHLLVSFASSFDIEKVEPLLNKIPAAYANDEGVVALKEHAATVAKTAVGKKFIDFEMNTPEGKSVKLSDFISKNKYTLIDFWASWCGPCRQEMPNVVAAYNEFKAKGFGIVGVSLDNNLESWKKAIKDLNITWAQMSDLKGWQCEGAALYGVRAIPATVLVDQEGIIVARNLRGDELKAKLAELMK